MQTLELTEELMEKVMDYGRSRGYAYRTLKLYNNELKAIFKKYRHLDRDIVRKILNKTDNTYKRAVIRLITNTCRYNDIDCPDFKIIAKLKKPRKIPQTFSLEEIKLMIDSVSDNDHKLFLRCVFSIGAGLRVSEVIKLKWSNFDWLRWVGTRGVGVCTIENTKRNKSFKLPVPETIMEALYEKARKENLINEFMIPSDAFLVFNFIGDIYTWEKALRITNKEDWIDKYTMTAYNYVRYNILQKQCEKAIGKKIKIHSLRHTKATHLLDNDFPIEEISELLGHSDIRTSMIYAKVNPKKIIKRFENIKGV